MGIEHRKINKRIRFTDEHGNALADSIIDIRQIRHAFLFGCGAFDFIPFVMEGGERNRRITDSWLEIFNYATLPFYWGNYEPEEGKTNKETLMKTAQYLQGEGTCRPHQGSVCKSA